MGDAMIDLPRRRPTLLRWQRRLRNQKKKRMAKIRMTAKEAPIAALAPMGREDGLEVVVEERAVDVEREDSVVVDEAAVVIPVDVEITSIVEDGGKDALVDVVRVVGAESADVGSVDEIAELVVVEIVDSSYVE